MKQTYEQRVRALAERMYRDDEGLKQDSPIAKLDWIISGEMYMKRARIAVAEMEEICTNCFREGWSSARPTGDMWEESEQLARSLGLIPDDGQEAGSDAYL